MSANSVANRVAAVLRASRWSMDRSGRRWRASGTRCRSSRPPRIGDGCGRGSVVWDDDVVGAAGGVGVERGDQAQPDQPTDDLGGDESRRGAGGDAGEGVGEDAPDGDRGVGEGGGAGEPVRGTDVGADGGRGQSRRGRCAPGRRSTRSGRRWRPPRPIRCPVVMRSLSAISNARRSNMILASTRRRSRRVSGRRCS